MNLVKIIAFSFTIFVSQNAFAGKLINVKMDSPSAIARTLKEMAKMAAQLPKAAAPKNLNEAEVLLQLPAGQ